MSDQAQFAGRGDALESTPSPSPERGRSARLRRVASAVLRRIDRAAYALFAQHADDRRHVVDRRRYRGTDEAASFGTYVARLYALSWGVCLLVGVLAFVAASALVPAVTVHGARVVAGRTLAGAVVVPSVITAACVAGLVGGVMKRLTVTGGRLYLRWLVSARRTRIERTLPGAVRYLNALAAGSDSARTMVARVATSEAYGGAAGSFRKVLNAARLTGSLDSGLRRVARDTPSRDRLAPFLLKFRQHATQGDEALASFLRTESRLLAHRREHARTRARRYLQPVVELFVFVLVVPAVLVVCITVASAFAPGLSRAVSTPLGTVSPRAVAVYIAVGFLLAVGVVGIAATTALRPVDARVRYRRPKTLRGVFVTAFSNPASMSVVAVVPALVTAAWLAYAGYTLVNVLILAYVAFAVPVGAVAARRGRLDDETDRRLADFVYAVAAQTSIGRPFPDAVEAAARERDFGIIATDVTDLAFSLGVTTTGETAPEGSKSDTEAVSQATGSRVRAAALTRFVERVGTPLASRTVGLVGGALHAGATVDAVFETVQIEVDRLTHEKRALREAMRRYVLLGWVAALGVAGVVAVISVSVMNADSLAAISAATGGRVDPVSVVPALERFRLYVVAQATLLASGWFAGAAARGRYGALLHSGALVGACYVGFHGTGLV